MLGPGRGVEELCRGRGTPTLGITQTDPRDWQRRGRDAPARSQASQMHVPEAWGTALGPTDESLLACLVSLGPSWEKLLQFITVFVPNIMLLSISELSSTFKTPQK